MKRAATGCERLDSRDGKHPRSDLKHNAGKSNGLGTAPEHPPVLAESMSGSSSDELPSGLPGSPMPSPASLQPAQDPDVLNALLLEIRSVLGQFQRYALGQGGEALQQIALYNAFAVAMLEIGLSSSDLSIKRRALQELLSTGNDEDKFFVPDDLRSRGLNAVGVDPSTVTPSTAWRSRGERFYSNLIQGTQRGDLFQPPGSVGISVFKARLPGLAMDVAIKSLPELDGSDMSRKAKKLYQIERGLTVAASSIYTVVMLADFAESFVMPRYDVDLQVLLGEPHTWPLSANHQAGISSDLLNALDVVHSLGVVHRDIKLDNIFVSKVQFGDGEVVYRAVLADFGLARRASKLTADTLVAGTPPWVAPELKKSGSVQNYKSDIYSAALVLWALWSKQDGVFIDEVTLVCGAIQREFDRRNIYEQPDMLQSFCSYVWGTSTRPRLDRMPEGPYRSIVSRMWHDDPDQRPTAAQLLQELSPAHP